MNAHPVHRRDARPCVSTTAVRLYAHLLLNHESRAFK